jgi:hypothetical protein
MQCEVAVVGDTGQLLVSLLLFVCVCAGTVSPHVAVKPISQDGPEIGSSSSCWQFMLAVHVGSS